MKNQHGRLRGVATVLVPAVLVATLAVLATVRLAAANAAPSVHMTVPAFVPVPGSPPLIPPPADGSIVVASDLDGSLASANADAVRPIASVAKSLTALVTLRARPLAPGQPGPSVTMTAA